MKLEYMFLIYKLYHNELFDEFDISLAKKIMDYDPLHPEWIMYLAHGRPCNALQEIVAESFTLYLLEKYNPSAYADLTQMRKQHLLNQLLAKEKEE